MPPTANAADVGEHAVWRLRLALRYAQDARWESPEQRRELRRMLHRLLQLLDDAESE